MCLYMKINNIMHNHNIKLHKMFNLVYIDVFSKNKICIKSALFCEHFEFKDD